MRLKYYLRGAGIGIIVTALILTLSGGETNISDREVIERAKKLGMVEVEGGSTIKNQISTPSSEATTPSSEAATPSSEASTVASSEAATVPSSQATPSSQEQSRTPDVNTTTVKKTVTIYLEKGVSTQKVSEQLQRLEIIDNADFFNKYLINNGYSDKLFVGECTFVKGMSRDEIINILTKGNGN